MRRYRRGRWQVIVHGWSISRPHVQAFWMDDREWVLALSWGSPGSDPVWLVERSGRVSERVGRVLDRWYARRA